MNKKYNIVPLCEVMTHYQDYIDEPEPITYPKLSVKLYGKGAVLDTSVEGSSLKMKKHQIARKGQVILSEIWGKKGAIGIVPPEGDGALCTSHFFLFDIRDDKIEQKYLQAIFTANYLEEQLNIEAQGTTGYAAVRPKHLLAATIPLPSIEEQRRILARIEELAAKIEEARGLRREAVEETRKLIRCIRSDLLQCEGKNHISDYATIQSGYAFKSDDLEYSGIRLVRNINISHGYIDWSQVVYISEANLDNYSRFSLSEGDILISLDRPIISTGIKITRVSKKDLPCLLVQRVGKVLFKNDNVLPEYFFEWLKSPYFENAINPGRSNGIPHISPKDIEGLSFSPPPFSEQHSIVEDLNHVQSKLYSLERHQSTITAELNALLPSILDKAFKGEL